MMPVRPVIQELRSKLSTIVDGDAPREAAVSPRGGQDARHVRTRKGRGGSDRHAFACVHVQHRQDPHRAPVGKRVVHEIHRPLLIRLRGRWQADPGDRTAMPPRPPPAERQPLFGIVSIDPLVVRPPPLPPEEHMQLLIAGPLGCPRGARDASGMVHGRAAHRDLERGGGGWQDDVALPAARHQ